MAKHFRGSSFLSSLVNSAVGNADRASSGGGSIKASSPISDIVRKDDDEDLKEVSNSEAGNEPDSEEAGWDYNGNSGNVKEEANNNKDNSGGDGKDSSSLKREKYEH